MPPKKRVDLPDHVRAAVLADVELSYQQSVEFDEASKIRIYLAIEQGVTTDEIAEDLKAKGWEISQQTVSRYSRQGKEAFTRREQARDHRIGEDPVRPGQREPVG